MGKRYYKARSGDKWGLSKSQQQLLSQHILTDYYRTETVYAITSLLELYKAGYRDDELAHQLAVKIGKDEAWKSDITYEGFTTFGLNYLRELGLIEIEGGKDRIKNPQAKKEAAKKNPPWTRDELILALDLYFELGEAKASSDDPKIMELSEILNQLPIHTERPDSEKFRNPNGVYMKICNFLRFDPGYSGVGLSRGNRLESEIWDTYSKDINLLKIVSLQIKRIGKNEKLRGTIKHIEIDETEEDIEDRTLLKLHKLRERNKSLVKKKKALVLQQKGRLLCEVCEFDFEKRYDDIGYGFIECHHKTPLHNISPAQKTNLKDLSLVCANCHRIIHRTKPMPIIDEFKKVIITVFA